MVWVIFVVGQKKIIVWHPSRTNPTNKLCGYRIALFGVKVCGTHSYHRPRKRWWE